MNNQRRKSGLFESRVNIAGFTLLELIMVMAVAATVLTLTAPFLRGFLRSRETADAAARIVALTRLAREQAIAQGEVFHFNYDLLTGRFRVTRRYESGYDAFEQEMDRAPELVLPKGVRGYWENPVELGETGWIPFYPDGRAQAASLLLVDRHGREWRIAAFSPSEYFRVLSEEETWPVN